MLTMRYVFCVCPFSTDRRFIGVAQLRNVARMYRNLSPELRGINSKIFIFVLFKTIASFCFVHIAYSYCFTAFTQNDNDFVVRHSQHCLTAHKNTHKDIIYV
uniref:Uncharacterized protein n=1 Tax=Cacopsylla melanoneura TaxID=428564 RepID=A0A8D9BLJ8_9HEMI